MSYFLEIVRSFTAVPQAALILPMALLCLYIVFTRIIRHRAASAWLPTLILLLDAIVFPSFFLLLHAILRESYEDYETVQRSMQAVWAAFGITAAWLTNRLLRRFVWQRYFTRLYGQEAPRILQHIFGALLYLGTIALILVVVFQRPAGGVLVSTSVVVGVVGLALQTILSDLFSGVGITLERAIRVGDWVEFTDGTLGQVSDITWQAIHLVSFNGSLLIVPNTRAAKTVAHNYSKPKPDYGVMLDVYVDAAYEPQKVRRLLLEAALSCGSVLDDPAPIVNLSDGSGNPFRYMVYVFFKDYIAHFGGKNDVYMNIHSYLARAGVGTSSPRYDIATRPSEDSTLKMPTVFDELRAADIFSVLDDTQIHSLAQQSISRTVFPSETIVEEGGDAGSLFIVTSGVVRISKQTSRRRMVEVTRLGAGDVIGEMSLLTGESRSATVTAIVQTSIIEVTKLHLTPILQSVPELTERFAEVILKRRLENEQFLEAMRRSEKATNDFVSDYLERMVLRIRDFFRL